MIHNTTHINHKNGCQKAATKCAKPGHPDNEREPEAPAASAPLEAGGQNVSLLKKRMRRQEPAAPQMLKESSPERIVAEQNALGTKCKRSQRLRTETAEDSKIPDGEQQTAGDDAKNQGQPPRGDARQAKAEKGLNGNLAQIINEIDQKEPHDYFAMKTLLESCERSQASSNNGASNQPHKFINEEEENEIVRQVQTQQRQLMEIDPLRELDVALMDRNTASKSRLHNIVVNQNASPVEANHAGKEGGSPLGPEQAGKSENTEASDHKQREAARKSRTARNKNQSFSEDSSQGSEKMSRKRSSRIIASAIA